MASSVQPPIPQPADGPDALARGLGFGLLGVVMFALTAPVMRLAVGPEDAPQLSPAFITSGRAALAGVLALAYLVLTGACSAGLRPTRRHLPLLGVSALGTVLGFPLFMAQALREVDAVHASVITGVLPLATAVAASVGLRQRASAGFWVCAVLGCVLVLAFAARAGGGALQPADGWLLLAVGSAAIGYVAGVQLSVMWSAERAISWVLVLSLPFTLPVAWATWPAHAVRPAAWAAFAYLGVFSMWIGFFAWYRGLALGGSLRVSQVQLVQPFLSMLFAVPLLGERLGLDAVLFLLAVMGTVLVGRRMPVAPARGGPRATTTTTR